MAAFSKTNRRRRLGIVEYLEGRLLLAVDFVADINLVPRSQLPTESAVVDGELYFQAFDPIHGAELWKTDGTAAGTALAHDISITFLPDRVDSHPSLFTSVNGSAYFIADTTYPGSDSWLTDSRVWRLDAGSEELVAVHTAFVADTFGAGLGFDFGIRQSELTNVAGTLFFLAADFGFVNRLLRVHGGEEAQFVGGSSFSPPASPSDLADLTSSGETLFFTAVDELGRELWRTSPTEDAMTMVKDIVSGPESSSPQSLTDADGTLFFTLESTDGTWSLWKSDGSEHGTTEVQQFASEPADLTGVGGRLFFVLEDEQHGRELWTSDGTMAGTTVVRDIVPGNMGSDPQQLTAAGDRLYFRATAAENGTELWSTDGTMEGTTIVKDINPGGASALPLHMLESDGVLYFQADDGVHGKELWRTNGTAEGTLLVSNLAVDATDANPRPFGTLDGQLLFGTAEVGRPFSIWSTDGSDAGTQRILEYGRATKEGAPDQLRSVGETLYFVAADGIHGSEIWTSDGTAANTRRVSDLDSVIETRIPRIAESIGDTVFFWAYDRPYGAELWTTDGSAEGTTLVKDISPGTENTFFLDSIVFEDQVFLTLDDQIHGRELWKSDGTAKGTVLIKDIAAGPGNSAPLFLNVVDDLLYFVASDIDHGTELWVTDGSADGTRLVMDASPGTERSSFGKSYVVNGAFHFQMNGSLWTSDGTADGTRLLFDLPTHTRDMIYANDKWHIATRAQSGAKLWISDGTNAGTHIVLAVDHFLIDNLTGYDERVFFTTFDEQHGHELWVSDGTSDGTHVIDVVAGESGSRPSQLTVIDGRLFFTANGKIWHSDGTDQGTTIVRAEAEYFAADSLTQVGRDMFFSAWDDLRGRELWKLDLDLPPSGDFSGDGALDVDDVDLLVREIAEQNAAIRFDLTGDGRVDTMDLTRWLAIAGPANGLDGPYLAGDANLDGVVAADDFAAWRANRFSTVFAWSRGDFNADGNNDVSDFNIWLNNRFRPAEAAVGEVDRPARAALPARGFVLVPRYSVHNATRDHALKAAAPNLVAESVKSADGESDVKISPHERSRFRRKVMSQRGALASGLSTSTAGSTFAELVDFAMIGELISTSGRPWL